jgi:hypothetical protein
MDARECVAARSLSCRARAQYYGLRSLSSEMGFGRDESVVERKATSRLSKAYQAAGEVQESC